MTCPALFSGCLPQPIGSLLLGSDGTPFQYSITSIEIAMVNYLLSQPSVACILGNRFFPNQVARDNTDWPACTYYRSSTDHEHCLSGSAGFLKAEVALDVWSSSYIDVVQGAEAIRSVMQGFQGVWGAVGIYAVVLIGESDSVETPKDASSTYWYSRSLDYSIMAQEPIYIVAPTSQTGGGMGMAFSGAYSSAYQ